MSRPPPFHPGVRPPRPPPGTIFAAPVNYGAPPSHGPSPRPPPFSARPPPRPPASSLKRPREPSPPPVKKKIAGQIVVQGSAVAPVSQIKVKKDYVPKALRREREGSPASTASGPTSKKKVAGQICPRCSQVIPHDQLESHMRIELLDPKWRDQKAKEVEWKRTKNLDDAGVAKVLSNISEFRTDIFDEKEGIDVREKLKQLEEAALSRESRAWDGHTATARTLATAVISSLTPEERAKDALRRRGMLVEGEQVGVQVPESMLDSGRDDRWRERGPGQREEMPEWFRDPTQMAMGGAMPGMVPGMGMMGMPPSDMTAAAYYASLYAQQQDSK